jgi:hypothetical protein
MCVLLCARLEVPKLLLRRAFRGEFLQIRDISATMVWPTVQGRKVTRQQNAQAAVNNENLWKNPLWCGWCTGPGRSSLSLSLLCPMLVVISKGGRLSLSKLESEDGIFHDVRSKR